MATLQRDGGPSLQGSVEHAHLPLTTKQKGEKDTIHGSSLAILP